MTSEEEKYDGIFMTSLQQLKTIDNFFDAVYGFLRRRTDFFVNQKEAERVITESCKKNFEQFQKDTKEKERKEQQKKEKEEQRKKEREAEQQKRDEEQFGKKEVQAPPPVEKIQEEKQQVPQEIIEKLEQKEGEKKEDDEKPPIGNGGKTDRYIWTQTLTEVQVYVPIPFKITKKELIVKIESSSLHIQIKGEPPLVSGQLYEKIQSDESVWTITDGEIQDYKGKYIHIEIIKQESQSHWWDSIIKGDPKINTQKISPEPSKVSDLDGETKGTVEKMMFDMRQKQMGLPSSDELQKRDKLKDFMKAHPEMDFSKCKFN